MRIEVKDEVVYAALTRIALDGTQSQKYHLKQFVESISGLLADIKRKPSNHVKSIDTMFLVVIDEFAKYGINITTETRSNEGNRMFYRQLLYLYFLQFTSCKNVGRLFGLNHGTILHGRDSMKGGIEVRDPIILSCVEKLNQILLDLGFPKLEIS